jgi:zinc/manganese transport system permease protein
VGRIGFYALFACAVTISVQLVGLYLVFATLVIPALATFYSRHRRLLKAYALGAAAYLAGLLLSTAADLPSGAMVVCTMAALGLVFLLLTSRRESRI